MTIRSGLLLLASLIFISACSAVPPPKEYQIEVTVLVTQEVTRIVPVTATPAAQTGPLPVTTPEAASSEAETPSEPTTVAVAPTATPTLETTPRPTVTPNLFPTPIVGQIYVAQQTFQNGIMLWLEPIDQIWVLTNNNEDGTQNWIVRDDAFEEGMAENDPELTPPASNLLQPIRGFGMLWRENDDIRSQLGWATSDEFGYLTNYEYHWGGTINDADEYVAGPGYHLLETRTRAILRLDESSRTWEIIEQSD